MNRENENNKEVISLKNIGASKWTFNTNNEEFICEGEFYNEKINNELNSYDNFLARVFLDDKCRVDEFFKGIKYESINNEPFNEIIFKFKSSSGALIRILARSVKSKKNIKEGYFFNVNNLIYEDVSIGYICKNNGEFINSIQTIFIDYDENNKLITFYGNNKGILGIDSISLRIKLEQCKKYIHEEYINLIDGIIFDNNQKKYESLELKIKNIDGENKWINLQLRVKKDSNGNEIGFEGYINDITNEKEANIKLQYISDYDKLTGLHNRVYLKQLIDSYIKQCEKSNTISALIIIDLDNFKFINDSYGHRYGDLFIKQVAIGLIKLCDNKEMLCRFEGDEFLIFIPNIKRELDVEIMANKIIQMFKEPFLIEGHEIYSTASIGSSVYPHDGSDFDELLKNADAAMYIAKSNGKNQYQIFDYNISYELNKIYTIQKGLRTALDKSEMFVVFQPKVILNNNKTGGFEALLRWKSEELGFVSPNEFIPIAEATRLIIPIGDFVLEEVFSKVKYLLEDGYNNFKIALNLSEVQLRDSKLIENFKSLIRKYEISPQYIEIEITESMLMKSFDKNIETLLELKNIGVSIALDDFGTGYSSLYYLTRLPIDVLKIDRSFVVDMIENHKSRFVVENIIELSHKLGIEVVAEGVEELEQVDYLKSIYCDIIQGYYYSKPKIFEDVVSMLAR